MNLSWTWYFIKFGWNKEPKSSVVITFNQDKECIWIGLRLPEIGLNTFISKISIYKSLLGYCEVCSFLKDSCWISLANRFKNLSELLFRNLRRIIWSWIFIIFYRIYIVFFYYSIFLFFFFFYRNFLIFIICWLWWVLIIWCFNVNVNMNVGTNIYWFQDRSRIYFFEHSQVFPELWAIKSFRKQQVAKDAKNLNFFLHKIIIFWYN